MKTIGFTCGAFDLLHAGHISMFEYCKEFCDELIVGLHTDPTIDRPHKNKPIQTIYERWLQLDGCKYVSKIVPYDTEDDLINLLGTLKFNVRFIGEEYINTNITGKEVCDKRNIQIYYTPRLHTYSSSDIRSRILHPQG